MSTHLFICRDGFIDVLFTTHADLSEFDQGCVRNSDRSAKCFDADITELNGDSAQNFILTIITMFEYIAVSHVQHFDEFGGKIVLVMMVGPRLPKYHTDVFEFVPMAFFVIDTT